MASASKIVVMNASKDAVMSVLKNYEAYADFMDGVTSVSVLSREEGKAKVEYSLNVIKKFSYILDLTEEENRLSWTFDSGDLFSVNSGCWDLKDLGDGTTEVDYSVEVDIKMKMMGKGMIVKKLTEVQLPSMLRSVEERAQAL
jgi:coenzyme Q-binding protein COQ10